MPETLRSSGSLSVAVAISRVLGLVRMSLFSRLLGAGAIADTYSVAFRIPNLLRDLFAEGALSSAFVPTFTASLVNEDKDAAFRLGNLVFSGLLIVTGLLSALGIVFAEEYAKLGFRSQIHGAPTCTMVYDGATGFLVGEPHRGLAAMFTMMNLARLSVGSYATRAEATDPSTL